MRVLPLALCLCPALALAEPAPLDCVELSRVVCEGAGPCREFAGVGIEVAFQPEPQPIEQCRALSCPPSPPTIAFCDLALCGAGTVHYGRIDRLGDAELRDGIAYLAPEPPPRLYASMHYALSYDTGSGRLALSRFDAGSLTTIWLACAAPDESGSP